MTKTETISNPVCNARGYHDWRTTKAPGLDRCCSCGHTRLTPKPVSHYGNRYLSITGPLGFHVTDSWTNQRMGSYDTLAKAQARARVLNSRQGA
jgi:hypothetical protein